ncbi:putative porin [Paraburkholderia solisilvae]|uniref:Porin n=1 Tax=Paraburkholderia solisilvae TaxID=624376 RepID=A0A6J5E3Y4_9BURK|nr:putative porin [Paraburkholderia solisilvae]CAB3761140.1 hypothetical protein LMG29739_03558 [Paraburkholderia solisilvae]
MIQKMVLRGGGQHGGGQSMRRTRISFAVLAALGMALTTGVHAQSLETQAAMGTAAPTESTVINLINLLVKRGVLTQQNANDLVSQAQAEAAQAKAAAARPAVPVVANAPTQPGDVAVPYVPQVVRDQIRDQVKQEVVAQAKAENWAQPNTFPDWVSRIKIDGDMRIRDEFHFFSPRNVTGLTDFAQINRNGGFDFNPNTNNALPPTLNTTQDRSNLFSVRARLGVTAQITDNLQTGIQLASGNDDDPVSTTQLLGGGFDKKDIWLNKAYVKYSPTSWVSITAGRFDNPFFSSDLLFDPDLEFDGFAANFSHALPAAPDITLFGTLGAFPVQYSDDNFPSNSIDKAGSDTKWLFAGQFGAEWKINEQNRLKGAIAYYDFQNSRGELSSPCALFLGATSCSTDNDAPANMQKGNTVIALRNIVQDPNATPGGTPDTQLFGLAYNYRLFDAKLEWDTKLMDRYKLRLDGEFVRNLSYDANKAFQATSTPVNNFNNANSSGTTVTQADYRSGGNGFMFKATLGEPDTYEKGQWNFSIAYKYLQPDAVLDAFTDSDFHLGGTNAKGYVLGAQYAVARDAWLSARYLSAREVYGPPLSIDVLQLELNARF